DAAAAAVTAQRALGGHAWPEGAEVRVRMGLHTGEPTVGEEGYLGLDVVRAARICSAGHGGQILMSKTTRALLGNDLPDGAAVVDLGRQNLKDVQHERIFLRPPTEHDLDAWAAMLGDPEVTRFLMRSTRREVAKHIQIVRERHAVDGFGLLAVVRKEDDRVIGRAGLLVWDTRTWTPTTLHE